MVFPKARLVVSAALFLGWIGFLAYLVAVTRDPVILSRPQILVCNLAVLADIEAPDGQPNPEVRVTEVLWAADDDKSLEGQKLTLNDLVDLGAAQGWRSAGRYLLPLTVQKFEKRVYFLTPLPPMPGFHATVTVDLADAGPKADQVTSYLQKALDIGEEQAKRITRRPGPIRRFLTVDAALHMKTDLEERGARVHLEEYETRIYRATDDALRQFHELK